VTRSLTPPSEASIADLVKQVSADAQRLVRAEIALARAELSGKARTAATGAGMFGLAGALGWFALGTLVAAAVLGLSLVWPAWLAALAVAGALLLVAGVLVLTGRATLRRISPWAPVRTRASVKADIEAVREATHR
jgi:hypothetical protein